MLLNAILSADDNSASREYADRLIEQIKTGQARLPEFIASLSNLRAVCRSKEFPDWPQRIQSIPLTFTIVNTYTCRYRLVKDDGVLMVAECLMREHGLTLGKIDRLYVFPFYACRNANTGDFEVFTLPLEKPMDLHVSRLYAERFFWALRQLPAGKKPVAQQYDEKKSWWRRITGT